MDIIIKTKNLELTESLRQIINKRMAGLEKFLRALEKDTSFEVILEIEKIKHHRKGDVFEVEAILMVSSKKIVAKSHGEDLLVLVTEVRDQLDREVKGYKGKAKRARRDYRKTLPKNQE